MTAGPVRLSVGLYRALGEKRTISQTLVLWQQRLGWYLNLASYLLAIGKLEERDELEGNTW